MRNFDLTPLLRSTVGFDRLNDLFESALRDENSVAYPPYNIVKVDEDRYAIIMAVAGFKQDDLKIILQKNLLTISGKLSDQEVEPENYLYKGIATRAFERKFNLAEHMKINDANLSDGLLRIDLVREIPEEVKPKQITINKTKSIE